MNMQFILNGLLIAFSFTISGFGVEFGDPIPLKEIKTEFTQNPEGKSVHPTLGAGEKFQIKYGSIIIPSTIPAEETVQCYYALPIDSKGRSLSLASDIVVYCPYPNLNAIESFGAVRNLAEKCGFTVVTIKFQGQGEMNDKNRYYIYPTSGSSQCWIDAVNAVRKIGGLKNKKIFCLGYSAGGSASQQLASAIPDQVDAAVFISGRTFNLRNPYTGPSLIMHSEHDRQASNNELETTIRASGFPPLHLTYSPNWSQRSNNETWSHYINDDAWRIVSSWLVGIANLRQQNGGEIPGKKSWKYQDECPIPSKDFGIELDRLAPPNQTEIIQPTGHVISSAVPKSGGSITFLWIDSRLDADIDDLRCESGISTDKSTVGIAVGGGPNADESSPIPFIIGNKKHLAVKPLISSICDATEMDLKYIEALSKTSKMIYFVYFSDSKIDMRVLSKGISLCKNAIVVLPTSLDSPDFKCKKSHTRQTPLDLICQLQSAL